MVPENYRQRAEISPETTSGSPKTPLRTRSFSRGPLNAFLRPLRASSNSATSSIDEVGYVPLAEIGAEFLFQVIAERGKRPP
jgi:hypothetical protein